MIDCPQVLALDRGPAHLSFNVHFLLHCHSYDAYRTDFLDSVNSTLQPYDLPNLSNALMLKLILYGDERLSVDSNSEILKATLRYIYATQRFE